VPAARGLGTFSSEPLWRLGYGLCAQLVVAVVPEETPPCALRLGSGDASWRGVAGSSAPGEEG
jgi:hypothetical protein